MKRGFIKRKKHKIVNLKKFISFILLMFTITIVSIIFFVKNNKVYSSTYKVNYNEVLIGEGDTLWDIAITNMPDKYDARKMVYEIMEFNHMKDTCILPGDLIKVPIKHNSK